MDFLYFAYGSNLDKDQMERRCLVPAKFLSIGYLPHHCLAFTEFDKGWGGGIADVVRNPYSEVWGKVYELTKESMDRLDSFEDYPRDYTRTKHSIITPSGHRYVAWVYSIVNKEADFIPPTKKYMEIIKQAAEASGFPESYLSFLNSIKTVDA